MRRTAPYIAAFALLTLACAAKLVTSFSHNPSPSDWDAFYAAGSTVGTKAFASLQDFFAWEQVHRLVLEPFLYLPGVAWFLKPLSLLGLAPSYALAVASGLACAALAGAALARLFHLPLWLGVMLAVAWPPTLYALESGQNATFGLMLVATATVLLSRRYGFAAGLVVGALAYKPTYAAPFLVLLLVRREWRALAAAACWLPVWYALSAFATHDWLWPVAYAHLLRVDIPVDFASNATQAYSIPALLTRLGAAAPVAIGAGIVLFAALVLLLRRRPIEDAMAITALIAIVCGPHVWIYDAVLALPMLCKLAAAVREPVRTRILVASYGIAFLAFASAGGATAWGSVLPFDPLAVVVLALLGFAVADTCWRPASIALTCSPSSSTGRRYAPTALYPWPRRRGFTAHPE